MIGDCQSATLINLTPYCKRSGGMNVERSGVSILFRTREWLTLAQLARAWGDELAKNERDRQHYVRPCPYVEGGHRQRPPR
jgi:hypothetical protein